MAKHLFKVFDNDVLLLLYKNNINSGKYLLN